MDVHMHVTRRLALLPDEKLMHLLAAIGAPGEQEEPDASRSVRVEVISRELRARGILGPPWWSGAKR